MLTTAPDSNAARKLKIDRELEEIAQDLAMDDARIEKDKHRERWMRKDPCAIFPLWRDPNLYAKKTEKQSEKDPWATRRLV